jgi:hypothetical protein
VIGVRIGFRVGVRVGVVLQRQPRVRLGARRAVIRNHRRGARLRCRPSHSSP